MESPTKPIKNVKIVSYTLLFLALISALSGVVIMTDIGQIFGIDKAWIIWYFSNRTMIQVISLLLFVAAVFLLNREKLLSTKVIVILGICWLGAMVASKYLTPYLMFRSQQHDSTYISIAEASDYLNDDDRVLVVDHNGVQKAYPPEVIWQAHIFGGDFGGEEVVFTYCVMTNLASPYLNEIDGETVDFKVLAQVNNNLLIWDTKSDEIIQQITQKCEFSDYKLDPLPVLEMTWAGYKKLYPEGTVVYNSWDDPMEKMIAAVFSTDDTWNGDDWMFNTANLDDKRLPSKEHIIGYRDDDKNEQLAITKSYIKKQGISNLNVGDKRIALVYFPEYETIVAFDRMKGGVELAVDEIDVFGNTPDHGKLERVYIYNSVLWGVWAAYYPDTKVLK
jgi:hypothetical protein